MQIKRTSVLFAATLVALLASARPARAQAEDCGNELTTCEQIAENNFLRCMLEQCGGYVTSCLASVPCMAMYELEDMTCAYNYDRCVDSQSGGSSGSTTCYLQCGDGTVASGACLPNETAWCSCDGRTRGESVDAYTNCCRPGQPCPPSP